MSDVSYPFRFRAAILEENNKPLVIDEVEFAGPLLPGQVLVKVHYSGVCGKQIEEIKGSAGVDPYLPHMLGHEGSGVVADCGPGVSKVKAGDRVVLHWLKGSGIDASTPFYTRNGKRVNAGWITTFNEYAVVAENRVSPMTDEQDMLSACILGCAGMTGLGVIIEEAQVRPGQSVAIVGCGGVGLCSIQAAKVVSCADIVGIDTNPKNLARAKELGATEIFNVAEGATVERIRNITGGRGFDTTIVTVGDPKAIELGANITGTPGNVFVVAVPPAGSVVTLDALSIHRRRSFTGSYGGGAQPDRDVSRFLEMDRVKTIQLRNVVGNVVSFKEINMGIEKMLAGAPGRTVIDFSL